MNECARTRDPAQPLPTFTPFGRERYRQTPNFTSFVSTLQLRPAARQSLGAVQTPLLASQRHTARHFFTPPIMLQM
jgi:hypothetical protein